MREHGSSEPVRALPRPAIPLALAVILLSTLLLVTNTIPSQRNNLEFGRELSHRIQEERRLRESIRRKTAEAEALENDPITLQREAFQQLGYTPGPRDYVLR
jgi:hypothetical protein